MKMTKKWITAGCMGIMLLAGFTGCTKTEETLPQTQEETTHKAGSQMPRETGIEADIQEESEETDSEMDIQEESEEAGSEADSQKDPKETENKSDSVNVTDDQSSVYKLTPSEGTEYLGGKVQSVADDGMIFAQTTVMGEGENADMVEIVDEKDAKKIPVKFTADTRVEHWIIQDGGAGIDMRDAAFSDLKSGLGVELEGYYEGDSFIATRILIEEYE